MSTLLAGDTAWWDDETVAEAFGASESVAILGADDAGRFSRARVLGASNEEEMAKALQLGYEQIVFFSYELSGEGALRGEFEVLPALLEHAMRVSHDTKVLYIATADIDRRWESSAMVRQRALEELCAWHRREGLDITVLRVPHPSDPACPKDFWTGVGARLAADHAYRFDSGADDACDFVDMHDVARLVRTIFDDWRRVPVVRLHAKEKATFQDAALKLREAFPQSELSFVETPANTLVDKEDEAAAEELYGFACARDVVAGLDARMRLVAQEAAEPAKRPRRRLVGRVGEVSPLVIAVELALGYAAVEGLDALMGSVTDYNMVDVRLLYVVMFSSIYGYRVGLASTLLMTASLGIATVTHGAAPAALFADPRFWLAFVLYFVVGSTLGYLRQKSDDDHAFAAKQEEHLAEQVRFVGGLYDEACESRNSYRHDLIESRDGFGRIFDVVKRLSSEDPARIFSAAIGACEDVLNTKKVAIYAVSERDEDSVSAHLVVCSEAIGHECKKTVRLEHFGPVLEVLEREEAWFNASFIAELPSYIAGLSYQGELRMLMMVFDATFEQASAYYKNLVRIMSGLMEVSLVRAWDYEGARSSDRHVGSTGLLTRDALVKELEAFREMRERHVNDYRVIQVKANWLSLDEVGSRVAGLKHAEDVAGIGMDGNVYVILNQVDETTLPLILEHYAQGGVEAAPCADEALI